MIYVGKIWEKSNGTGRKIWKNNESLIEWGWFGGRDQRG